MTIGYTFPADITLDEVRELIKDNHNFIIVDKGDYIVVNYVRAGNDTFPSVVDRNTAILRELRGLIFSPEGKVIARRFHKFFNYGEREDLLDINVNNSHRFIEKLDGCLSASTTIKTPYGYMTIKEVCLSDQDIPVMGYDHKTGKDVWVEVQDTSVKESIDNWYRITLDDGRNIEVTDNHKVWCVNKKKYLTVLDLEDGDEVRLLSE
jgi:hypothetical protein